MNFNTNVEAQPKLNLFTVLALVFVVAIARLLPHPWNFTPIGAMALFAGARINNTKIGLLVTLSALLVSDTLLGLFIYRDIASPFYNGFVFVYIATLIGVFIGKILMTKSGILRILGAGLLSSVIFFLISNFGVWLLSGLYARSIEGLVACYVAAIPFFSGTLGGTLFYSIVMYYAFGFIARVLKPAMIK